MITPDTELMTRWGKPRTIRETLRILAMRVNQHYAYNRCGDGYGHDWHYPEFVVVRNEVVGPVNHCPRCRKIG